MDLVDRKYVNLISSRLQKFKQKNPNLYNFRCPICGDSQKRKNVARGYLYSIKTNANYKCHNCGASMSFSNFLKTIDVGLHKQFVMEKFKEGHTGKGRHTPNPKFEFETPIFKTVAKVNLPLCSEVDSAKEYLEKRKLDPTKFFFTNKFKQWTNTHKQTFDNITRDESRIVIPLYDVDNNLIGFQGRSLGPNSVKYITVMINEEAPKIYGLDKVKTEKPIYILEGPFDSTLVENSVAMCGSDLDIRSFGWSSYIWVFDNEPRNREIIERIHKTINRGDKVVIWPSSIQEKDVNDMINSGHDVRRVIESNTYSGLQAKIKFNYWKKI